MATEDLEARVAALESQLRQLTDVVRQTQQDAAAARVLAGAADRDVSELVVKVDANRQAINALGEQTRARFDVLEAKVDALETKVDAGFTKVDAGFAQVDAGFAEVRGRLDATAAGQETIAGLLTRLIERQGPDQAH